MLLQIPVQGKQHFLPWPSDKLSLEVSEEEDQFVEGKVSVIYQIV